VTFLKSFVWPFPDNGILVLRQDWKYLWFKVPKNVHGIYHQMVLCLARI